MGIVAIGLNHKSAPLACLERVAVQPQDLTKALARLLDHDSIHEGVILSTCNRTEVYATVHRFHESVGAVRWFLSDISGVAQDEIARSLYSYHDEAAVEHLFAVASGLDSMVVGEPQILGQVRDAFRAAQAEGAARRVLGALFQRALRVGKRARSETQIARHVVSLPQAAARMASELVGPLEGRRAVVVGAGHMGALAARAVSELGCVSLVVCNRRAHRAVELAERLEGARGASLEELPRLCAEADVIISATTATEPVLDRALLETALDGRREPLAAIDLGMPRDIDPEARALPGLLLRDIEDLREIAERGMQRRRAELPKVERIVSEEAEAFFAWERSLALGPSIAELRAWSEDIRRAEIERVAGRLELDDRQREGIDALTRSIVNKLLHRPVTQVKELVNGKDGQIYLEAFQELFELDVPED